jgi:uncharacterized RDD family membrane protein YckC
MSSPASAPALLAPGTRLAHYRLAERLGSGAMGTVYAAHDLGLDRGVAVKVLHEEIAQDPAMVQRFFREARAAARVSHANLAHVYYVGSEGSHSFFAMEHVPGEDLEETVKREGPLPLPDVVDVITQAARGLAAAHAAGLVHRDVKPSNLIRRPDGVVKVTDFGLARSLHGDADLSGAGAVTGTPTYMSPEQVRGETAGPRTDVYALGLTMYYLLAGQPPFPGPTLGKVLSDQLNAPLPLLAPTRPELAPSVDEVLARLCSKDPARRPAGMDDVLGLLERLRPRRVDRAPLAARGTAYVLDWLMTAVVWAAFHFLLTNPLGLPIADGSPWTHAGFFGLWTLGQLGMEVLQGASLGKQMLHLAVAREDGMPPARRALLLRFVVRCPECVVGPATLFALASFGVLEIVAAAALLAGAIASLFTQGRTLSDLASRTAVVYRHPT